MLVLAAPSAVLSHPKGIAVVSDPDPSQFTSLPQAAVADGSKMFELFQRDELFLREPLPHTMNRQASAGAVFACGGQAQ